MVVRLHRPARRRRRLRPFAQGAPQTHGRIRGWSLGERASAIRQWPRLHQRRFPEGDCPDRRGLVARATISRASSSAIAMWSSTNFRGRSFVIPTRGKGKVTNTRNRFWEDGGLFYPSYFLGAGENSFCSLGGPEGRPLKRLKKGEFSPATSK